MSIFSIIPSRWVSSCSCPVMYLFDFRATRTPVRTELERTRVHPWPRVSRMPRSDHRGERGNQRALPIDSRGTTAIMASHWLAVAAAAT